GGSGLCAPRRPAGTGRTRAGPPGHPGRRRPARPPYHRRHRGRSGTPAAGASGTEALVVPPAGRRGRRWALLVRAVAALMRDALRGLTIRGRSFLAAAAAAALSAAVLGEKDLLRVAALLAVLPLLAT